MQTFNFSPEIEQSLASLVFYNPKRIETLRTELDFAVHIQQPHIRAILEAIELMWLELETHDFVALIQVLAESGQLEACGGTAGVAHILEQYRYGFVTPQAEEKIFNHYVEMLKAYAIARDSNEPVYRFVRGSITLPRNKLKHGDKSPDFSGVCRFLGRSWSASAYISPESLYISLFPR